MILKDYTSSISLIIGLIVLVILSRLFYGKNFDSDLKYYFFFISFILINLQQSLYNDPFEFNSLAKPYAFGAIIFVAWAILTLASQSKRGEFLKDNLIVDKISFIFISIIANFCAMNFNFINDKSIKVYDTNSSDFLISMIIALFIHFALKYIVDKGVLKKYFVNNDIYKKIFLISEIIFILFFVIVTFYNIFNFDRFIFISLD